MAVGKLPFPANFVDDPDDPADDQGFIYGDDLIKYAGVAEQIFPRKEVRGNCAKWDTMVICFI